MPEPEIDFRYQMLSHCKTIFSLFFCNYNHSLYQLQFTSIMIKGITAALIEGPYIRFLKAVKEWSKCMKISFLCK